MNQNNATLSIKDIQNINEVLQKHWKYTFFYDKQNGVYNPYEFYISKQSNRHEIINKLGDNYKFVADYKGFHENLRDMDININLLFDFEWIFTKHSMYLKDSWPEAFREINSIIKKSNNEIYFDRDSNTFKRRIIISNKLFLVHGKNKDVKNKILEILNKHDIETIFIENQTLEDSNGETIKERLDKHMDKISAGLVLYTPCDEGREFNSNEDLKPRARQNVVFEHGMLVNRLGYDRVIMVVKDNVEIPTDLGGIVYIKYEEIEQKLLKQLFSLGFNVVEEGFI